MKRLANRVLVTVISLLLLIGLFGGNVIASTQQNDLDKSLKQMGFPKDLISDLDIDAKADLVKSGGEYAGHSVVYLRVYKDTNGAFGSEEITKEKAMQIVADIEKKKKEAADKGVSSQATISDSVLKITPGQTKLSTSTDPTVRYKFYGQFQWLSDPINRWVDPFVISTQTVWSTEVNSSTGWYKYDLYTYPNVFVKTITDDRGTNYDDAGLGFIAYYFDLQAAVLADESYRNHRGYVSWIGSQVNHKNSSDLGNTWATYFHETMLPTFGVDVSGSGGSIGISPSYAFDKQVKYTQFTYNH